MATFLGDSGEYEMLTKGIELSKDVDGLCLEIGTRLGLSAKTILDAIRVYCPNKTLVCVDPYGSLIYEARQDQFCRLDYDNKMQATCIGNLWMDIKDNPVSFKYFDLTDIDFFEAFSNGVPIYNLERRVETKYSFVFFDGPHGVNAIIKECEFFLNRTSNGGVWVFDDITPDFYNHSIVHEWLLKNEFKHLESGFKKGMYIK